MSCIVDNCKKDAKFYCLDCLNLKVFCKNHGTDHMIAESHTGKVINEQNEAYIRSKQIKQKINALIDEIITESNLIISTVQCITTQIIRQVKKINLKIEKMQDFSEIKFNREGVKDVIERINCLNQNLVNAESQNLSEDYQKLKLMKSELPSNVFYELLDEKFNSVKKVSHELDAKIKKAVNDYKFTEDLCQDIKFCMMRITAKGLLYLEFNSLDFENKKIQIKSILPSIKLVNEKELAISNDGKYLFYCNLKIGIKKQIV